MFHTSHCWYVCNTLKIKVPVLEQKYVRFETTKLNLRGSKNSCLAFVRRLLPLKHLWKEQTLEVAFEKRMDSDFYDEMLQILVSPTVGLKFYSEKTSVLAACPNVILTNISCNPTEVVDHLHCGELQTLRIILDCCWSEDEANLMRYLIKEKFQAAIVPQSFVLAISSFQRKETKDFENLENIQTGESLAMTRADVYLKIRRTKLVVAKDKMKAKK
uniref:Uncharacterized protein n=1 Tax=Ditylenchus dipsaci TaxID=166011 RepID=A0A915DXY4_9BILA